MNILAFYSEKELITENYIGYKIFGIFSSTLLLFYVCTCICMLKYFTFCFSLSLSVFLCMDSLSLILYKCTLESLLIFSLEERSLEQKKGIRFVVRKENFTFIVEKRNNTLIKLYITNSHY